ncbi:hypothetical protein NDU88_001250 [Pleurodeles waltl]|uniref:Uncharacterized protein n=1 Tax=Pleurodeles waltl TaxID=8319 RepID=A0AAV7MKZ7_PLEWA|nr:hypothetical protein NDU88_001250 [Pleurodeles waltl]
MCDGLVETRPHTLPTCAVAASGVPEQQGLSTNVSCTPWTTREGGTFKRSAEKESERKEWKQESGESAEDGEKERDNRVSGQEAIATGTLIGGSGIKERSFTATCRIRPRRSKEETGTPR